MLHKEYITQLIKPNDTVLDLSIAMAFWFAARGIGTVDGIPFKSTCKVVFSGIGADEQLGGYSRHLRKYNTEGVHGLLSEMQLDVSRISTRNLGRDDRVISDHGKEVRCPYLAEDVVSFLSGLPVDAKCDFRMAEGGDKFLLRNVAKNLGLERASKEKKRAVQFGARSAKLENTKEKGATRL